MRRKIRRWREKGYSGILEERRKEERKEGRKGEG